MIEDCNKSMSEKGWIFRDLLGPGEALYAKGYKRAVVEYENKFVKAEYNLEGTIYEDKKYFVEENKGDIF